jgi:hypothetical protein
MALRIPLEVNSDYKVELGKPIANFISDSWCRSHQSVCGLSCNGSVLVNDCTRTKDDATQTVRNITLFAPPE